MKIKRILCFLICLHLFLCSTFSQNEDSTFFSTSDSSSIFNEWEKENLLKLKLETNFSYLVKDKRDEDYQSATLTVYYKTENAYETPVKVKGRGKFRRKICDFPPLKIKLKEKSLEGIKLGKYKTFKLVTHCHTNLRTKANVIKEFLAYKIYEAITEQSYRTQLVEITYVDQGKELPYIKRYGILIEDVTELEDRLNVEGQDSGFDFALATPEDMDVAARTALFQFMIGNADFNLPANRNVKLFKHRESQLQIPIPFDFDFTGLVHPSYTFPNPDYDMETVLDRVMLGWSISPETIEKVAQQFRDKKEVIFELIDSMPELRKADKKSVKKYLGYFFKLLEQPLEWEHKKVVPHKLKWK